MKNSEGKKTNKQKNPPFQKQLMTWASYFKKYARSSRPDFFSHSPLLLKQNYTLSLSETLISN